MTHGNDSRNKGETSLPFLRKMKAKSNKQMTKVHHKDDLRDVALNYEMLALEAIFTKKWNRSAEIWKINLQV